MAKRIVRKLNSPKIAKSWLERGILPIPLKPKSKRPVGKKGWEKLRITEETIHEFFIPGQNVGGLWGEPSGWIVDLDLDWNEAADVAQYLLPKTFVYGRRSRPETHYLFRCQDIATTKVLFPKLNPEGTGQVIVEIRSTGAQSVLPPSIHDKDLEPYHIDEDEEIKSVTPKTLKKHLNEISAAAVIIRYFPGKGGRHDYYHMVTGALLHSHWKDEDVLRFMMAIWEVLRDQDDDPFQRKRTIEQTITSFREKGRVQGWNSLSAYMEGPVISLLRRLLIPEIKVQKLPERGVKKRVKDNTEIPTFDETLLNVPGLVGSTADWFLKSAHIPHPSFALAVGLMSTAVIAGNKYMVGGGWNTPLQPYFLLLAPTAAGKGDALGAIKSLADEIGMPEECTVAGFQSYFALLDHLQEHGQVCWTWDEAARHLASARNPSSQNNIVITHVTSLYGAAQRRIAGMPGRNHAIPPLDQPCLKVFAAAQPTQLVEAVSAADVATGFINRLVLFDVGNTMLFPNDRKITILPSAMKKQAVRLRKYEPKFIRREDGKRVIKPTMVELEMNAYTCLRDFLHSVIHREDNEMWGRAHQNALILAGLVAVGVDPAHPKIDLRIAEWAIKVVSWSIECWTTRLTEQVPDTKWNKEAQKIESYIRNARKYADRQRNNPVEQKLLKEGLMPWSPLLRLAPCSTTLLNEHIERLVGADLIGVSEKKGTTVYWGKN